MQQQSDFSKKHQNQGSMSINTLSDTHAVLTELSLDFTEVSGLHGRL